MLPPIYIQKYRSQLNCGRDTFSGNRNWDKKLYFWYYYGLFFRHLQILFILEWQKEKEREKEEEREIVTVALVVVAAFAAASFSRLYLC